MGRHTLRLQAELLDRAVVPGVDFHVRLAVDTVGADDAEREPVRVSAITCEWHGTERLDPAWVRPPKGVSASSSSRGGGASTSGGGLAPGTSRLSGARIPVPLAALPCQCSVTRI